MITSALFYHFMHFLHITIEIRNVCVFLAPLFSSLTVIVTYFLTKELKVSDFISDNVSRFWYKFFGSFNLVMNLFWLLVGCWCWFDCRFYDCNCAWQVTFILFMLVYLWCGIIETQQNLGKVLLLCRYLQYIFTCWYWNSVFSIVIRIVPHMPAFQDGFSTYVHLFF